MRPTTRDLADAHEDLDLLAYAHDPNGSPRFNSGFREVAKAANLFAYVISEIRANERAAPYSPGVEGGYHTLNRGGGITSEPPPGTRDAHAKALRNLLAGWRVALGQLVMEMEADAMDVGRYPTRTETSEVV